MSAIQTLTLPRAPEEARTCRHCGTGFHGGGEFCCQGCHTVFDLLGSSGLQGYYDLKANGYCFQPAQPVNWALDGFEYLDARELRPLYVSDQSEARFYVEGIHCVACLWLLENLPKLTDEVLACRLDISQAVLTVKLKASAPLSPVAAMIQKLGYRPHAIPLDASAEAHQKAEHRRTLLRLGIAGACAGNIMLMAVSLYGGARGEAGELFRWVSLGLFLPVLGYSAIPFYQSALGALRLRRINIDVPIVLAIVLGAVVSTLNLLRGSEHIYFDSLAALIFLLLASRYYLRQVQAKASRTSQLVQHFFAPIAHRMEGQAVVDLPPDRLKVGDQAEIRDNERVPADGRVVAGDSFLNAAWLTGEHQPVAVKAGDAVFAGSRNEGGRLVIEVDQPMHESRLGRILQQLEADTRSPLLGLTDRVSRYFLAVVLALAMGVFLAFAGTRPGEGLNRALSLLIVTCPCALALATPLTFSHALGRAYRKGYIVKSGEALERLSEVNHVFFDKTGTLTRGEMALDQMEDLQGDPVENRRLLLALEARSLHPIARAIRHHLSGLEPLEVEQLEERAGEGLSARASGRKVEVRSFPTLDSIHTVVALLVEGRLHARITLSDQARQEAPEAVAALRAMGCGVGMLSGDADPVVRHLAHEVGIPEEQAHGRVSPERKLEVLKATPGALMVGDGANDALALQHAHVGIAMHGGMDLSLKASDVYLSAPDLRAVADLILLGRETRKVLRRNFALSIAYNLVGGVAALFGWINPFVAAVIMPLSSITVLVSSTWSTRAIRARFKEAP
jgi:heavy metal translocating P-type ATPase